MLSLSLSADTKHHLLSVGRLCLMMITTTEATVTNDDYGDDDDEQGGEGVCSNSTYTCVNTDAAHHVGRVADPLRLKGLPHYLLFIESEMSDEKLESTPVNTRLIKEGGFVQVISSSAE